MTDNFNKWFHAIEGFNFRSDRFSKAVQAGDLAALVGWLEEAFDAGTKISTLSTAYPATRITTPQAVPVPGGEFWWGDVPASICYNLHLCGSRFFSKRFPHIIPPHKVWDSDVDFAAPDLPYVRQSLIEAGFKEIAHSYNDSLTTGLFTKPSSTRGVRIEVSLKNDIGLYMTSIGNISGEFYRDKLWKSGPNHPDRDTIQDLMEKLFAAGRCVQAWRACDPQPI